MNTVLFDLDVYKRQICRMLNLKGYNTCTCVIGDINKATKDFKTQLRINENLGISIVEDFADCDIFVDAIFGVGLSREVEGKYKDAVEYINNQRAKVYAVDIPVSYTHLDVYKRQTLTCVIIVLTGL